MHSSRDFSTQPDTVKLLGGVAVGHIWNFLRGPLAFLDTSGLVLNVYLPAQVEALNLLIIHQNTTPRIGMSVQRKVEFHSALCLSASQSEASDVFVKGRLVEGAGLGDGALSLSYLMMSFTRGGMAKRTQNGSALMANWPKQHPTLSFQSPAICFLQLLCLSLRERLSCGEHRAFCPPRLSQLRSSAPPF